MWTFRVWAPGAKSVAVRTSGQDFPMTRGDEGWWQARVESARAGSDYAFVLDGGAALPDPRSAWQPHGVHEASRSVDQNAFAWSDTAWQPPPLSAAIVYELHIGTFTPAGTFESAIERLDYLKELGVTHVELMPVNEFSGDWGWGYDGVDLYAPHHSYGGPKGLKRLVDACHARGLAVLLDVVYNHLGPAGNYLSRFGPYFTKRYSTPWGEAINLDGPGSVEVRRFFCDNALMWLRDYHFDGLRLDAIHALLDTSALHFLEQLRNEVGALEEQLGRAKVLIAESDMNDPRVVNPPGLGGYGIDAQWSDDFHHALHAVLTGETKGYYEDFGKVEDIAKALRDTFVYDGRRSAHRERAHGRPATAVSSHRFLGYLQTHDQVGNRAQGERISHLVSLGRAKIGAVLVLTSPFLPMLFQGEEFGASAPFQYFTHHDDPELAKAVTEGRKREFAAFGWRPEDVPDPQDPETFRRSHLNWKETAEGEHRELLEWHRDLIRLRKTLPELSAERGADFEVECTEEWIHVRRGGIHVLCNLSREEREIGLNGTVLLASERAARAEPGRIFLPGESAIVLNGHSDV